MTKALNYYKSDTLCESTRVAENTQNVHKTASKLHNKILNTKGGLDAVAHLVAAGFINYSFLSRAFKNSVVNITVSLKCVFLYGFYID